MFFIYKKTDCREKSCYVANNLFILHVNLFFDYMMRHYRLYILVAIIGLFVAACEKPHKTTIKVVCTSDVHGNFFPYNFVADTPAQGSLARVSSYLSSLRMPEAYGKNVIYIDNGDILHGQPTTYYYNTVAVGDAHLAAEVLNYLGCDAAMLGNHDIEAGGSNYQRFVAGLDYKVTAANIVYEHSSSPFVRPYITIVNEGVKIVILGLTTAAIPEWLPKSLWQGIEFADMEATAKRWMAYIQEYEQPDVTIGLFHSGYEGGIVSDEYVENATRSVAERVPGFDAICYGHDHKPRTIKVANVVGDTVVLINPGRDALKVAALDITYDKQRRGPARISIVPELVDMDLYEPDSAYMEHFSSHLSTVKEYAGRKIGALTHTISSRDACFGSSDFIDFIHQIQLEASRAQISLAAPFAYDATLTEGDILVRDMFDLYRYENTLYTMRLTGREIKDYLEMSYSLWVNQMKSPDDHLLLFDESAPTPRLKNPLYNFDSAAGIIYEVDVTKPVGERINIKRMANGKPFEMNAYYLVALNSYKANGGGGLLTEGAGIPRQELARRIRYTTDVDLRYYMLSHIEMKGTIGPQALNHWKFVPEDWCNQAAKRDSRLLFGE